MQIKLSANEMIETDDLTVFQMEALLDTIVERCDSIASQHMQATAKARTGEYSDPDWFRRMVTAKRKMNQVREKLRAEIGARKKAERMQDNYQDQLPKHFIQVAKIYLSDALFDQIMQEATRRYADTQQGAKAQASYIFEVGE